MVISNYLVETTKDIINIFKQGGSEKDAIQYLKEKYHWISGKSIEVKSHILTCKIMA